MKCIISTRTETNVHTNLTGVRLPTQSGSVQIKTGHTEYILNTVAGEVVCTKRSQKPVRITVPEGSCRVIDDTVTLVV